MIENIISFFDNKPLAVAVSNAHYAEMFRIARIGIETRLLVIHIQIGPCRKNKKNKTK
jgi:hypothetical protein